MRSWMSTTKRCPPALCAAAFSAYGASSGTSFASFADAAASIPGADAALVAESHSLHVPQGSIQTPRAISMNMTDAVQTGLLGPDRMAP